MINQTQVTVVFTLLVILLASFVRERRFMEKQLLTALLVLLLLAPQTGLEAKSRHHGVKDSYHDSQKHHHKAKKRHHKSKKHHHSWRKFYRFARATNAELELLNQAVSDIDMRVNTLESQGGEVPDETLIQLREDVDLNREDIDINIENIGINESGVSQNSEDITQNEMDIAEIRADILEIFELISELHPQPPSGATFSGEFIGGQAPGGEIVADWSKFTSESIGMFDSFSSIKISSSIDEGATLTCTNEDSVNLLATALSSSSDFSTVCDGQRWMVTNCPSLGVELRAGLGASTCTCSANAIVIRPLVGSRFWGGAGLLSGPPGPTCGDPTQTLEVVLTPKI
jgi:hypothetical protein